MKKMYPIIVFLCLFASANAVENSSFSFDAPPGPQFSEIEKQAQLAKGERVMTMVMEAYRSGSKEVRIPPGDYRFAHKERKGSQGIYPLEFNRLQRDADHPFTIDATDVTFWFDLGDEQLPPGHSCVGFINCRNIIFKGATLDRGSRGNIEGCIAGIDVPNNRFEVRISPGITVPSSFKDNHEQRLLPFKADGRFCAPLYSLQMGGDHLRYKSVTPADNGRYWITMKDPELINTIRNPNWERAYGDLGILKVGDGLSCVLSTAQAISLVSSASLTMSGLRVYVAKGGGSETGGEGSHLWKDCYFGPRPGTSQWQGGDGYMFNATRHGATLDNVTIIHSTDDIVNFHGYWGVIEGIAGNRVTFKMDQMVRLALEDARPGDHLRFIDKMTGKNVGESKITEIDKNGVTLDTPVTATPEASVEWIDHECGGWTVQNCQFHDNLQRLLILSGPGIVRHCTMARQGSSIDLNTAMAQVGGVPSGITIQDNVFTDVGNRPAGASITARGHSLRSEGEPAIENLHIERNVFERSGGAAIILTGVKNARIINNQFESPIRSGIISSPNTPAERQAIVLRRSSSVEVASNILLDPENYARPDQVIQSTMLGVDDCNDISLDGHLFKDVPKRSKLE